MRRRRLWMIAACCVLTASVHAEIHHVPSEFSTIQNAIDAAVPGDTVLVARGVYYENITFRGKNIVVMSSYGFTGDVQDIYQTIMNGSMPVDPDSASVVRIIGGEDSSAVLQGFTITGGTGTAWPDEHSPGTFREGGGIHIALSSPTIRDNLIIKNHATSVGSGLVSAGGGGIRAGDGNPRIINNVIMRNFGLYGAGIVLNYTGALLRNNVICQNEGGGHFGGGGVWINSHGPAPKLLENNTIVGNIAYGPGGGIDMFSAAVATLRNNIIRGNFGSPGHQIYQGGSSLTVTYCNIEGGWAGTGNFDQPSGFADSNLYLTTGSASIDAGDPDSLYYDPAGDLVPELAEWPSMGGRRNDAGAYGGPQRTLLAMTSDAGFYSMVSSLNFGSLQVGLTRTMALAIFSVGAGPLTIDSAVIKNHTQGIEVTTPWPFVLGPISTDSIHVAWTPVTTGSLRDTLLIYHRDTLAVNPKVVRLQINVLTDIGDAGQVGPSAFGLHQNYPNPFNPSTDIGYDVPEASFVKLNVYSVLGQQVRSLVHGMAPAGRHTARWDGRNDRGQAVGSGLYLYRLEANGRSWTKKMVHMK